MADVLVDVNPEKAPSAPDGRDGARADILLSGPRHGVQRDDYGMVPTTLSYTLFTPCPSEPMVAMQAAMIRATITAYSTAVAPSSEPRKPRIFRARLFIRTST